MASSSSYNSPCAACKFLRRKCMPGCIFAPYFPPEEPQKFANVHKIFGASNVTKLLNELLPHQREDAVNSLAYEAEARVRDPVYGCVSAITFLQRQVHRLQKELDAANADLIRYGSAAACGEVITSNAPGANSAIDPPAGFRPPGSSSGFYPHGGGGDRAGLVYDQQPPPPAASFFIPYGSSLPWEGDQHVRGGGRGENM